MKSLKSMLISKSTKKDISFTFFLFKFQSFNLLKEFKKFSFSSHGSLLLVVTGTIEETTVFFLIYVFVYIVKVNVCLGSYFTHKSCLMYSFCI